MAAADKHHQIIDGNPFFVEQFREAGLNQSVGGVRNVELFGMHAVAER